MDTCVPSPNLMGTHFAPSPLPFSIYEQDKSSLFCGSPKVNSKLDVCGTVTEESGLLDDNIEDSLLTQEMISLATSSSSTQALMPTLWNAKVATEESSSHDQGPFMHNEEYPDFFFTDIWNIDSNDSKFSIPDFDCMASNPPSSCHTPVPSAESRPDFVESSLTERFCSAPNNKEIMSSSTSQSNNIGQDFVQKFTAMKSNFPPRKSEPPVAFVAPVKVADERNKLFNHHSVKLEIMDKTSCTVDMAEASPQTVPSFTTLSQKPGCGLIKSEPVSPELGDQRECLKRSSTHEKWNDTQHLMCGDSTVVFKSKRRRCDSGSSGVTSEDGDCDDNDYAYQNDDDSDDDNSDLDADLAHMKPGGRESLIGGGKKQKQYFWQYNVQAKGPKGTRLKLAVDAPADPHILNGFEDPVFDEGNTTVAGIRHGGKARKGDGNEVSPNPFKLFKIGHQLLRLNKKINACQLGSDVPVAQRNESRKEKNKLASRACRLKKKAQHEANKVKLHGLEMEHGQINNVLRLLWPELRERVKYLQNEYHADVKPGQKDNLLKMLNGYITSNLKNMVAGHTTDYVNEVIMTVEKGDTSGGLNTRARKT